MGRSSECLTAGAATAGFTGNYFHFFFPRVRFTCSLGNSYPSIHKDTEHVLILVVSNTSAYGVAVISSGLLVEVFDAAMCYPLPSNQWWLRLAV